MKASIVWSTPEAENLLLYMARVSNPKNQNSTETGLIKYLIKNKHWSPFEMINLCVEIETSRAISAQIIRHRSFTFQEFSQRYAEVEGYEPIELRKQSENNRQSSTEVFNPKIEDYHPYDTEGWVLNAEDSVALYLDYCYNTYNSLLRAGVAKECARLVLPLCAKTRLYMNGTLRSWIHYIDMRTDEHTQKEHRDLANEIKKLFVIYFPVTAEALGWITEEVR